MSAEEIKRILRCSFCGKTQEQVKRLIAGPYACICDECVEMCSEILRKEADPVMERKQTR